MASNESNTPTEITMTDAWQSLHECRNILGVLRRALDSEETDDLEAVALTRAVGEKISVAMGDIEEWSRGKPAREVRREAGDAGSDDSNVSDILEDLRNRIRWASGTADCISGNPNMDGFVIDSCSSIEQHLREAWELVDELSLFGASLRKGGAA